jgi:acyl-CoA synthetase (AMP-forming)/AMP-acid ligase II
VTETNFLASARAAAKAGAAVHFLDPAGGDVELSYDTFHRMSAWLAERLPPRTAPGPRPLLIAANNPMCALLAFFAALSAGDPPLIVPGPRAVGGEEVFQRRLEELTGKLRGDCAIAIEEDLISDPGRLPAVPVLTLPAGPGAYGTIEPADPPAPGDVAFLQMTSASTGDSKLVAISDANICANLRALNVALGGHPGFRFGSWLPLYHDMGLVGAALLSFFHGWPLHIMKPTDFIMRPHRWTDMLSRYRCTITAAPNFGYDYATRMISDAQLTGVDLSALERAVVGAEPIGITTLDGFHTRFGPYGMRPDSIVCSYGMAESTLATTMVRPRARPRYLVVDLAETAYGKPVHMLGGAELGEPVPATTRAGVAVFSCGTVLDGLDLALVDDDGRLVEDEETLGEVTLRGTSVAAGYFDYDTRRPLPFPGGRLHTGDLGFLHDGELFLLDRRKHVIIRQGQNFLASLLEDRVGRILGRPPHDIMVIDTDIHDPGSDIVVVVENYDGAAAIGETAEAELRNLELPVDELRLARKRVIPRTTSGKKRYEQMRRQLAAGTVPANHRLRLRPGR